MTIFRKLKRNCPGLSRLGASAFLLLGLGHNGFCQQDFLNLENWNPGYLVTVDDDTLYGPVMVLYNSDLAQVNEANRVKTFGANQIQMVYLRENETETEHYIYSFPYHPSARLKPHRLFEMLYSGPGLSLLCRETLAIETVPLTDAQTMRVIYTTRARVNSDFFILYPDKKVRSFRPVRKELLPLFGDRKEAMQALIKKERLSLSSREDLIRILTEYNRLTQK
jgi:hypothetical protein